MSKVWTEGPEVLARMSAYGWADRQEDAVLPADCVATAASGRFECGRPIRSGCAAIGTRSDRPEIALGVPLRY